MNLISPYDLETGHTYYIESYNKGSYSKGVRTKKYRGVINNLNAGIVDGIYNVLEIGNIIEYVNGQETTSTERDSPTFPGNVIYISVSINTTDNPYWLFYKPVVDYLMTTQVLKQRTRLDKVSIWGLYKQHLGKAPGEGATSGGIPPLTYSRRKMKYANLKGWMQLKPAYPYPGN